MAESSRLVLAPNFKTCFELLPFDALSERLEFSIIINLSQPGMKILEFLMKESGNYPLYVEIHGVSHGCRLMVIGSQITHAFCKDAHGFAETLKELNKILTSRENVDARIYKVSLSLPLQESKPIVRLIHALYISTLICQFEQSIYYLKELEKKIIKDLNEALHAKADPRCRENIEREFREMKKKIEKKRLVDFLDQVQAFAKIYNSCVD
ncbi:MAG: hypothetical protein QXV51_01510 [Thermosphaera sp.]